MQRARAKADRRARAVDAKASKGRKVRYDVHAKLVNFMAPGWNVLSSALVKKSSFTEFPIPSFVRFRHVLFWEFPWPAWAVASCRSGPQAGGTP